MCITRNVQNVGYGPVPHITRQTESTGTVVQFSEILPVLEAPPVLFHRNTLLDFPLPYLICPIYWEHLSREYSITTFTVFALFPQIDIQHTQRSCRFLKLERHNVKALWS